MPVTFVGLCPCCVQDAGASHKGDMHEFALQAGRGPGVELADFVGLQELPKPFVCLLLKCMFVLVCMYHSVGKVSSEMEL